MKTVARFVLVCGLFYAAVFSASSQSYSFTTLPGLFNQPSGVAADSAGNIYVADTSNDTIRKISPTGTNWVVTTLAGLAGVTGATDGTNSDARFNTPFDLALDSAGNLFIADTFNNMIRKMTPFGTNWIVSSLAGGTNNALRLNQPVAIRVDKAGNLYVADRENDRILKLALVGTNWIIASQAGGLNLGSADGTNKAAQFAAPAGVAVDNSGSIFVADTGNETIRKITPVGTNWVVSTIAGLAGALGSADGTNSSARFFFPVGIVVDGAGSIYVGDNQNSTIRKMTPARTNWVVSTLAGLAGAVGRVDGTGTAARFTYPACLTMDNAGNLYVADMGNDAIRLGSIGFSLQTSLSGSQLILSWPILASNFVLETSSALNASVSWTPLSNGIAASGDSFVLTNSTAAPDAFFRLHKP